MAVYREIEVLFMKGRAYLLARYVLFVFMGGFDMNIRKKALNHLRQNIGMYLVIAGVYTAGVAFGALGVGAIQPAHQQELASFLQQSLTAVTAGLSQTSIFGLIWENLKVLLVTYVLGMTVIGMPLIFVLVFTRGFVLGFAAGFLIEVKSWQGILVTAVSILPPSLLNVPVLIVAAVSAITFSISLVRGNNSWQGRALGRQFAVYSLSVLVLAAFGGVAALFQGYVAPVLLKAVL